jgi:orotate phosphoribosyltransferase
MVNTGTATDAVTIAAVTSAALALMINSLMFYLLVGIKRLLGSVDTQTLWAWVTICMVTPSGHKSNTYFDLASI